MELVIGATLWLTFFAFLLFPELGAPPAFSRMAIGLCGSELIASCGWAVARDGCHGECPAIFATAKSAAEIQIPVLTAAMFIAAIVYGLQVARSW